MFSLEMQVTGGRLKGRRVLASLVKIFQLALLICEEEKKKEKTKKKKKNREKTLRRLRSSCYMILHTPDSYKRLKV